MNVQCTYFPNLRMLKIMNRLTCRLDQLIINKNVTIKWINEC